MRERSYLGAVLIAVFMLSTPLFVATPQPQSLPEGDVTVSTDKHCYSPGEEVRITATGWARLPSIGDFPDIFWAITDEYGDPVFETLNAFDMIWDFSGTLSGIWNQTYRLHNDSKSGSPVPPGVYAIWFYVIPPPPYVDWPPWIPATVVIGDCNANLKVLTDKDCYKPGEYVNITLFNAGPKNLGWSAQPPSIMIFDSSGAFVSMGAQAKLLYIVEIGPNGTYPTKLGWDQTYLLYDYAGRKIPPTGGQVPEGRYVILVPADYPAGIAGTKSILIDSDCGSTGPTADAGPDQTVNEGDIVYFDGGGSHDGGGGGKWAAKKNIPSPRSGGGSDVLNDEVYYVGGGPGDLLPSPSSAFQKYTPASDSWSNLPNLPAPRVHLGAAVVGGRIYAIGGQDVNVSTADTTFEFDPATSTWSSKAPMPIPMEAFGIAVVGNRIYVIGGTSTWLNCSYCGEVFEYDPAADVWSSKANMPTPRKNLATTVLSNRIYVVGGIPPSASDVLEIYDPAIDTWTRKANMTTGRWGLSASVLGGNVYAFGGIVSWDIATNVSEMYDPSADRWTSKPSMLEPRMDFGSGVVNNCIYAFGGYRGWMAGFPKATEAYCLGDELAYAWDFDATVDSDGDGNSTNDVDATGPTPTHVYGDDGEFTVTLMVTDEKGRTATDTAVITVLNVAPTIASYVIPSGNEGASLTFEARITDPGSDDLKVTWSGPCMGWSPSKMYPNNPMVFPDPYPSPEVNPRNVIDVQAVTCGDNGLYGWYLKAEDDDGGITTLTGNFAVANLPTFFGYTFCPQIVGCEPTRFEGNLTGYWVASHDPGSDDMTYTWTWGDGSPSESATYFNNGVGPDPPNSPNGTFPFSSGDSRLHAFGDDGVYIINVTGEDDDGGVTPIGAAVTILNLPPSLTSPPPQLVTVDEGTRVTLNATATDPGSDDLTFTWTWQYGPTTVHPHYNNGIGPDPPNSPGGTFPFTASDSSSFTYGDNGVYSVSLIVSDDDGGSITYSTTITVNNVPPTVDAVLDTTTDEGSLLSLTFSFSDPGFDYPPAGTVEDFTATVSWGDGTSEVLAVNEVPGGPGVLTTGTIPASHYYADNGIYTATVTVCDDDGGCGNTSFAVTVNNVPPTVEGGADKATTEASPFLFMFTFSDPGFDFPPAGTVEDFTAIIDWGYGPSEAATVNEIPGSPGVLTTGTITANHMYGDNGIFTVTVTVCDDDGGCGSDSLTVTVDNVPPVIDDVQVYVLANITLRVAGEKWHDVRMDLVHDGTVTGTARVVRHPGSPDDQAATIVGGRIQLLGDFRIILYYTPDDDPINGQPNGANPAWVIVTLPDGNEVRFHHTFNVQHPDTWTWTLDDFRPYLVGQAITFSATASDVGSDDITFTWSFGDGSPDAIATYFNNGMSPDPYPSPEVNPITATDIAKHISTMAGAYTVTLTVTDDDGGSATYSFSLVIG